MLILYLNVIRREGWNTPSFFIPIFKEVVPKSIQKYWNVS